MRELIETIIDLIMDIVLLPITIIEELFGGPHDAK